MLYMKRWGHPSCDALTLRQTSSRIRQTPSRIRETSSRIREAFSATEARRYDSLPRATDRGNVKDVIRM